MAGEMSLQTTVLHAMEFEMYTVNHSAVLKGYFQSSINSITWGLVIDAHSPAHLQPTESEILGVGLSNLCFNWHVRALVHAKV